MLSVFFSVYASNEPVTTSVPYFQISAQFRVLALFAEMGKLVPRPGFSFDKCYIF